MTGDIRDWNLKNFLLKIFSRGQDLKDPDLVVHGTKPERSWTQILLIRCVTDMRSGDLGELEDSQALRVLLV